MHALEIALEPVFCTWTCFAIFTSANTLIMREDLAYFCKVLLRWRKKCCFIHCVTDSQVFFISQIFYLLEWLFHRSGGSCLLLCHICVPVKWCNDEPLLHLWNISEVIQPRINMRKRKSPLIHTKESATLSLYFDCKWVDPKSIVSKVRS